MPPLISSLPTFLYCVGKCLRKSPAFYSLSSCQTLLYLCSQGFTITRGWVDIKVYASTAALIPSPCMDCVGKCLLMVPSLLLPLKLPDTALFTLSRRLYYNTWMDENKSFCIYVNSPPSSFTFMKCVGKVLRVLLTLTLLLL